MKNLIIVSISALLIGICHAQETIISPEELAELRKNPDMSNAVIMEQGSDEPQISLKELENNPADRPAIMIPDPDNPEAFSIEAVPSDIIEKKVQPARSGITGVPYSKERLSKFKSDTSAAKYSGPSLDTHALALAANCEALSSSGKSGMVTINLDESFFVIPTKAGDLPPFPRDGGKAGIHGSDVNKNCVRDDIEHYVFKKYPDENQESLRLNLYAHAIWLNFFLIKPISDRTIQGITRQNIKTGGCMSTILGEGEGKFARDDLFAHFHNTIERTERYFENYEFLRGFMIEENIIGTCL